MSLDEDESHMAMWCILAAPLVVGGGTEFVGSPALGDAESGVPAADRSSKPLLGASRDEELRR